MVNKKTIRGIAFVVLMLSVVLIAMAAGPTVTVTNPTASESINGTYTLKANVVPQANTTIASVEFLYQNSTSSWISIGMGTGPASGGDYTLNWDTTSIANGSYTLNVTATDNTSNVTSDTSRTFSIANAVTSVLSISANQTSVTVGTATDVVFTVTSSGSPVSGATVTLSGVVTGSNTTDTNGNTTINVNAASAGTITATASRTGYTSGSTGLTAVIFTDTTPPASVTGLTLAGNGTTWLNISWTNPTDVDFNHVMVYKNGTFVANTTLNTTTSYNITGLNSGTAYGITVYTVDAVGNINATGTILNAITDPNTPVSPTALTVTLSQNSSVTFPTVTGAGNTVENSYSGQTLPSTYIAVGNYLDISTSATVTAPITVSVKYNTPLPSGYTASDVRLYHWNAATNQWDNVTTSPGSGGMVTGQVSSLSPFVPGVPAKPVFLSIDPTTLLETTGRTTQTFKVTIDQTTNVTWSITPGSSTDVGQVLASVETNKTYIQSSGNYTVSVTATNTTTSMSNTTNWTWTVHPKTYAAGNRVWDGGRPELFSLTYTWNPMSFPGFYYDIDSDVGNESITMKMNSYSDRTVNKGNIVYGSTPEEVKFGYSAFGSYQVIGFMAEKYFAGYTANSTVPGAIITVGAKSTLGQRQLHKVLFDDDTKRTISVGSTLTLKEGYVLKARDISTTDRIMLMTLLKDGNEVDTATLTAGQTYVYAPSKVGAISDLPIILVRFDSVFSGTEVQAAFLKGIFQISSSPTTLKTGDMYNDMKITTIGQDRIEMKNDADVTLSKGNTEDLMGDIKILVADNDTLRFALSTEKTGTFEVRSTVYRGNDPNTVDTWNPYNFGMNIGKTSVGFYYDLDDGIGNESLRLVALSGNTTGSIISAHNLVYTTTPEEVNFGYSAFGSYQVIGFMADKYFAGYTASSIPATVNPIISVGAKSTIGQRQLHKVLIDDDTKRTISVGSTLTLQEGYVLKARDISVTDRIMLMTLLKDGTEVDTATLQTGETYVYAPSKVGTISDLPIIIVRFDSVFSGTEVQAAFLKGIFQISSSPTTLKTGDTYDDMKVTTVGQDKIEMNNENDISLDNGKVEDLMGNIKLKVGDTTATDNALRFYFAVDVTPEMVANQLVIDAPAQANAGELLNIKVTAGGNPLDGVSVAINSVDAGQTGTSGFVNYTLPRTLKGNYNITATKLGYQQATKAIEILQYIDNRLSILAPATANQFSTITIKITYNGTAISGATVGYDNATIGTSDINGMLNYTLQTSGTHTISVAKSGYVAAIRDINVRAPFSQYQALDINIIPGTVSVNEPALITSNITNVGTKADTLPVELISNGTVVDNKTVSLAPGEIKVINFTRKEEKAGNYTIEIIGQKGILEVKEQSLSLLLIGGIATVIGLIAIYLLTAKGLLGNLLVKIKGLGAIKK